MMRPTIHMRGGSTHLMWWYGTLGVCIYGTLWVFNNFSIMRCLSISVLLRMLQKFGHQSWKNSQTVLCRASMSCTLQTPMFNKRSKDEYYKSIYILLKTEA